MIEEDGMNDDEERMRRALDAEQEHQRGDVESDLPPQDLAAELNPTIERRELADGSVVHVDRWGYASLACAACGTVFLGRPEDHALEDGRVFCDGDHSLPDPD